MTVMSKIMSVFFLLSTVSALKVRKLLLKFLEN
jgi:hypothetical protein